MPTCGWHRRKTRRKSPGSSSATTWRAYRWWMRQDGCWARSPSTTSSTWWKKSRPKTCSASVASPPMRNWAPVDHRGAEPVALALRQSAHRLHGRRRGLSVQRHRDPDRGARGVDADHRRNGRQRRDSGPRGDGATPGPGTHSARPLLSGSREGDSRRTGQRACDRRHGISRCGVAMVGDAELGLVVFLAMAGNLFVAGFAGAFIPFLLERFQGDPAIASSIFVTTFTDVCGFLLLLGLAGWLLLCSTLVRALVDPPGACCRSCLAFLLDRRRFLLIGRRRRRTSEQHQARAARFTTTLAELGPTFIKLAQVFAALGRTSFPEADFSAIGTLTDQVPRLSATWPAAAAGRRPRIAPPRRAPARGPGRSRCRWRRGRAREGCPPGPRTPGRA